MFQYANSRLHDQMDEGDVMALANAIERGDKETASRVLDVIAREDRVLREWISKGRTAKRPLAA